MAGRLSESSSRYNANPDAAQLDEAENAWPKIDQTEKKLKNDIIDGLKKFQAATGIDESKYIKKLEKATHEGQVRSIEAKTKNASIKWYQMQLLKSGMYDGINAEEQAFLDRKLRANMDWFQGQELATGDYSMIEALIQMKPMIENEKKFRSKLKRQSKYVKEEYSRKIKSLPPNGNERDLLDKILSDLKGLEKEPSAVQREFKKAQKNASVSKSTGDLLKEIKNKHETLRNNYLSDILKNKDFFGGKDVKTPYGKIPETALEFIEWFDDGMDSFSQMKWAHGELPKLISIRKRLFKERDEALKDALPKDRERILAKTKLMRRHELEAFLPDLKAEVRRNSIHVAEFMATLIGARARGVELFTPFEQARLNQKFKLSDVETQKARLLVLEDDLKYRRKLVEDYFAMPRHLRNDQKFIKGTEAEREKALKDAQIKEQAESDSPFKFGKGKVLSGADTNRIAGAMESAEGQKVVEKMIEDMKMKGLLEAAKVQSATYRKIYGAAKTAKENNKTQKEHYLDDLKFWIRLNKDVTHESDAKTEREKAKFNYIKAADKAYDEGFVFSSGGEIDRLQVIQGSALKAGNQSTYEKLNAANYGEHIQIRDMEGGMAKDPLSLFNKLGEQEKNALTNVMVMLLSQKYMNLGAQGKTAIQNSDNIKKSLSNKLAQQEFMQHAA